MIRSLILMLVLFGLFGVMSSAYSQLNPNNLTRYSETDGNNINAVISDQFGYIWMATHNGLIRFDGYDFERFYNDPNDSTSISDILTFDLFEDSRGQIWIGGMEDINVYNPVTQHFKTYYFGGLSGLSENEQPVISSITENKQGRVYFGVESNYNFRTEYSILYYDRVLDKIEKVDSEEVLNAHDIVSSTSDPFGNSWFIGDDTFLRIDSVGHVQNVSKFLNHPPVPNYPMSLHSDKKGRIWISTEPSKLSLFDPQTEQVKDLPLNRFLGKAFDEINIINIHSDPQDKIWLATQQGIFQYDELNSRLISFSDEDEDVEDLIVTSLDFDSFGNIWLSTYSKGLYKYLYNNEDKFFFQTLTASTTADSELTPGWANRITESNNGNIWIVTTGQGIDSGVNKIHPNTGEITRYKYSELKDLIFGLADIDPVSDGNLVFTNYNALFKSSPENLQFDSFEVMSMPDSVAMSNYHEDRYRTEWIATDKGLFEKKAGNSTTIYHDLRTVGGDSDVSNYIVHLIESQKHGLWVLTNNGLFNVNLENGEITRHGYNPNGGQSFISQDINSIYDDESGILWVGTWQGGLSRYNLETGETKNYTRSDGLPSMGIQYILHDQGQNDLWLSTFDGLSRFNIDTEEFINFTTNDGIQSQLFSDGSGLKSSSGNFYFGGSGGVTFFNPADILKKSLPPIVNLTDIKASNESLKLIDGIHQTDQIDLEYNQNTVSFDFVAIHYTNPARNRIAYILENYDDDWHQIRHQQKTAYYPNLPPGMYRFKVIAANSNGIWNEEGASVNIRILPPWWRTWWAYGFYFMLLIVGFITTDRVQRRRLLQQEREKAREKELEQAKEIEKAYKNLEVAHEELKAAQDQLVQQEKLASLGQLTAGIAHEIKNPLNFVNNFSDLSVELIEEIRYEVERVRAYRDTPLPDDALDEMSAILDDIETNLRIIHQHGTRADGIVKSMLQHSRGGSRKMEPTDVNDLIKEYANLAFHGMRAGKDPINVDIELDLNENVGEVEMITEDFSRVILNLCNNAFDAMREKANVKRETADSPFEGGSEQSEQGDGSLAEYNPKLTVRTKKKDNAVIIEIHDNGPGIPDEIKDKILQPFFTTKKGTAGTGLGLSITNDIIKAHRGNLEVYSDAGTGTRFKIHLSTTG